jgi:hypothetical protein
MAARVSAQNSQPKKLYISFYHTEGKELEFFIEGDDKIYRIKDYNEYPGWFFGYIENKNRKIIDTFYDKYENAGVKDIWGLYDKLKKESEETLEGLLGERIPIKEVIEIKEDYDPEEEEESEKEAWLREIDEIEYYPDWGYEEEEE